MKIADGQKGEGKKSCTTWFDADINNKLKKISRQLNKQLKTPNKSREAAVEYIVTDYFRLLDEGEINLKL